jgi:hypothetical protein
MNNKKIFSRPNISFGSNKKVQKNELDSLFDQGVTQSIHKNIHLFKDLTDDENESLFYYHYNKLNNDFFNTFKPQWNLSKKEAFALQLDKYDEINKTLLGTDKAYRVLGMNNNNLPSTITKEQHKKLLCLHCFSDYFKYKNKMEIMFDVDMSNPKDQIKVDEDMASVINKFKEDGEIISVLKEAEGVYADVTKLSDQYSIRMGDGEYFVASDGIKICMRDPSDNPAWATWFLDAVPLGEVPDRSKLFFLSEGDRKRHMPEAIPDRPIICHATLWKLEQASGVLLTTSWNHISVTYRWKIDKPFEISSLLFKSVSHPAHIARNFGYAPQMRIPGDNWF